ncbi:chlorophyll a-b binding protein, chloroplastic [Haematococcus lacustris]|uniref:Chlorophyll a-b binding protein, chloroplastic n=1 Tax=Haematococcus lacustris TaxID=44745 RepID=A0A699YQY8_HAELA|nr:chlorophyll a-b binding protein, chloroplastic [Haematococcus lacustris]
MRGQSGFSNSFPFDPVGLSSPMHAVNEVKNGRLAMVSAASPALSPGAWHAFKVSCPSGDLSSGLHVALQARCGPVESPNSCLVGPLAAAHCS